MNKRINMRCEGSATLRTVVTTILGIDWPTNTEQKPGLTNVLRLIHVREFSFTVCHTIAALLSAFSIQNRSGSDGVCPRTGLKVHSDRGGKLGNMTHFKVKALTRTGFTSTEH
jgi:hypothetical protein